MGTATQTWGRPLKPGDGGFTPGDGHLNLGMRVYTWGWPLTPGDGGFTPGDGHSHMGMAGLHLGMATHT